ncbi:MAG: hypothetical protein ACK4HE_08390 [Chitinophagaceae bacterium]
MKNTKQSLKHAHYGVRIALVFVLAVVMGIQLVAGSNVTATTGRTAYKKISTNQVVKQHRISEDIVATVDTESDDDNDEENDKKSNYQTTHYTGRSLTHYLIAQYFSSAIQQRVSYLEQAVACRPAIPYFLLYHSWKTELLLVS